MLAKTTGMLSASALATEGGSTSGGSSPIAFDTLSRTSLAAVSRSMPSSNSAEMLLRPSRLVEVRVRRPGTALIFCSSTWVICDSITAALAPA
jgi:hypothetical protein